MRPRTRSLPRSGRAALIAFVLVLVALAFVPALRDERRLSAANAEIRTDPAAALRISGSAVGPATRSRVTAVTVQALAGLGELAAAERVAREDVLAHPDDPFAVRRLHQIQVARSDRTGARRTLRVLRRLDPKFADGTGF